MVVVEEMDEVGDIEKLMFEEFERVVGNINGLMKWFWEVEKENGCLEVLFDVY